jgi:CTP:molybdopterin cytidylyltransferase MocA
VTAAAAGDEGARPYLRRNPTLVVECADVADGRDIDTADELAAGHRQPD